MDDIRPPRRPIRPRPKPVALPTNQPPISPAVVKTPPTKSLSVKQRPSRKCRVVIVVAIIIGLLLSMVASGFIWYKQQLQPVSSDPKAVRVRVEIASGSTPAMIAQQLHDHKLIHSTQAFWLYTRWHKAENELQAGVYSLSPHESLPELVGDLTAGKVDDFTITFLPGATLAENRRVLLKAGYSAQAVDLALNKTYDHPLFASKPAGSDLEGYIYGETYTFPADATPETVLLRTFDEYWTHIEADQLVAAFKEHHLTLYEGITLASIIQREVARESDEKQVAQVFYKRLSEDKPLGSDVTYKYAAKRFNLIDSPDQDSAYNTRKVKGLPPGPIAVPGLGALEAVAYPAKGSYEYFLAGDDGKTYFAHTFAQHEKNIRDHCKINCAE